MGYRCFLRRTRGRPFFVIFVRAPNLHLATFRWIGHASFPNRPLCLNSLSLFHLMRSPRQLITGHLIKLPGLTALLGFHFLRLTASGSQVSPKLPLSFSFRTLRLHISASLALKGVLLSRKVRACFLTQRRDLEHEASPNFFICKGQKRVF